MDDVTSFKDPNGANIQLMQLKGRPGRLPVLWPGDPPAAPRAPMLRFDGGTHRMTSRAFFEMRAKVGDWLARQLR